MPRDTPEGERLARVVREVRRALVESVANGLNDAVGAPEPVADARGRSAVAEGPRANHDQRRHPIDADALGDPRVARDLAGVGDEDGESVVAPQPLDAGADRRVIDALVADDEEDDRLAVGVCARDRLRKSGPGDELPGR